MTETNMNTSNPYAGDRRAGTVGFPLPGVELRIAENGEVFYLDKIPGTRGLEMRSRTGQRMPLASTGLGKALMLGHSHVAARRFAADPAPDYQDCDPEALPYDD